MVSVVVNREFGGFDLSEKAVRRYCEINNIELSVESDVYGIVGLNLYYVASPGGRVPWSYRDLSRDDPVLVSIVREIGQDAAGNLSRLEIVEIPDDIEWELQECGGIEWVVEKHRRWPE